MKENRDGMGFFFGLLVGSVVGATVAIMLAPDSGEKTREVIKGKASEYKDQLASLAAEYKDKAAALTVEYREKIGEMAAKMRENRKCECAAEDAAECVVTTETEDDNKETALLNEEVL